MNRYFLIGLLLVLLAACDKTDIGSSQKDSFVKFYNTYPVFTGSDVKEIPGKGYAFLGTVESFVEGTQICLIRTDYYGNSVDSARYYGRSLDDKAISLQVLNNGDLALLGSSVNPTTGKKEVFLARTDSAGNIKWNKYLRGTGDIVANQFAMDFSGSFIMAGYADTLKSGALDKDIWLYGLDANGNKISGWTSPRRVGGAQVDIANDLKILDDGRIIITGQTWSYPVGTTTSHAFFMLTKSTGGVVVLSAVSSSSDESGNSIQILNTDECMIAGTSKSSTTTGSSILLLRINFASLSPTVAWEKYFSGNGNDSGQGLLLDDQSAYMLGTEVSTGNLSSIRLVTTDLDGNNPGYFSFGQGSQVTAYSMERTSDNGFIVSGTNKHSENNISMVLIKLKPDGTL